MALHGAGHIEFKKSHKGDFQRLFVFVCEDVQLSFLKKISFLQFYSRFSSNALALGGSLRNKDQYFGTYRPAYRNTVHSQQTQHISPMLV